MKKLLLILAYLIAFCCAMQAWQFYFPIRLFIFDLLTLSFIFLFLIRSFAKGHFFVPGGEINPLFYFLWGWFFIVILSSVSVIYSPFNQDAFIQYYKGLTAEFIYATFFTFFIVYLSRIEPAKRNTILNVYIAGVICSSLYELAQTYFYFFYNIELDSLVWDKISFNVVRDYNVTWAVEGLSRATGFPSGPNIAATYAASALPLLFLRASYNRKFSNILLFLVALMGLLLTMSRTGVVTFIVSMAVLALLERKRMLTFLRGLVIATIPLGYLGYIWRDTIAEILSFRTHVDYSRLELYEHSLKLFFLNPLTGVGYNNYSVARAKISLQQLNEPNVHSSWLNTLLELGIVGFLFKVAFIGYLIYAASRRKSMLSRAFSATVIGLSAGALFSEVLESFYTNFFFVIMLSIILLEPSPDGDSVRSMLKIGNRV